MKLAIVGDEGVYVRNLAAYVPPTADEIVSTGENLLTDTLDFSRKYGFKLTVFFEDSYQYTTGAWILRNMEIAEYADELVAFRYGNSRKMQHMIECFERNGKLVRIVNI